MQSKCHICKNVVPSFLCSSASISLALCNIADLYQLCIFTLIFVLKKKLLCHVFSLTAFKFASIKEIGFINSFILNHITVTSAHVFVF